MSVARYSGCELAWHNMGFGKSDSIPRSAGCRHSAGTSDWHTLALSTTDGPLLGKAPSAIIRNINIDPGWFSYLTKGAFYTKFSITAPEFLIIL